MGTILYLIHIIFLIYTVMIAVRIIGSWFPSFARHRIMHFIAYWTDPFLNLFRKIIPPIGGMLDISPILAFLALQFLERILTRFVIWAAYGSLFF